MPIHTAVARNFAAASENRIHSDEVARRFGFTGALVPGVTVFAHLTAPLTKRFGARWLERSRVTTRFNKPAYEGDALTVVDVDREGGLIAVECKNSSGVLLATLECSLDPPFTLDEQPSTQSSPHPPERVEISWDTVHVGRPFAPYLWLPDHAHNREYAAHVDDSTPLFQQGVLHPHALLSQANQVLVRQFVMPAWIHTGSDITFRRLLRVGEEIEVRAVPLEKWERKGHHFLKLHVAYVARGALATEIDHTAIFRVAQR
jgi:acyl dehydratase